MANEEGTMNLNDPHCQEFIEAMAACLVHLPQRGARAEDKVEKAPPMDDRQVQS